MKIFITNLISFGPALGYTIFSVITNDPNTGIDWSQVVIAGILGIIGHSLGKSFKEKGQVK